MVSGFYDIRSETCIISSLHCSMSSLVSPFQTTIVFLTAAFIFLFLFLPLSVSLTWTMSYSYKIRYQWLASSTLFWELAIFKLSSGIPLIRYLAQIRAFATFCCVFLAMNRKSDNHAATQLFSSSSSLPNFFSAPLPPCLAISRPL
jgi:hypothetical protein